MKQHVNKIVFYSFVATLAIFMAALMVGPRIPDSAQRKHCVHNIYINNYLGFSLNCDSPDFIILASDPGKLLEKNNVRQDRPGAIIFIAFIKYIISIFISDTKEYTRLIIGSYTRLIPDEYITIYFYYIFMNIVLVIASFVVYNKLFFNYKKKDLVHLVGLLLIFNDITKAFIWSPHSQIMNIFVPIFCLWCFVNIIDKNLFYHIDIFFISILAGLGATAYASFFLFLPSVFLSAFLIQKSFKFTLVVRFVLRYIVIILLVLLPSILWYFYVLSKTGSFYSHSKEAYQQIVWMKEAYQQGFNFLFLQLSKNFFKIFMFTVQQGYILLIILLFVFTGRTKKKVYWREILLSPTPIGCIFISIIFIAFFSMVGLVVPRVAYSAFPPLIVLTAHIVQHIEQNTDSLADSLVPVIIFSYGIYEIVKDGPYS